MTLGILGALIFLALVIAPQLWISSVLRRYGARSGPGSRGRTRSLPVICSTA